jgi:DNA-binding XRE family transcriptional regulator
MAAPGRRRRADSQYAAQAVQLAARLRQLREQAGLTQEQLAARAEVAVATVRKIETGVVVEPGYFTVMALLRASEPRRDTFRPPGPGENWVKCLGYARVLVFRISEQVRRT